MLGSRVHDNAQPLRRERPLQRNNLLRLDLSVLLNAGIEPFSIHVLIPVSLGIVGLVHNSEGANPLLVVTVTSLLPDDLANNCGFRPIDVNEKTLLVVPTFSRVEAVSVGELDVLAPVGRVPARGGLHCGLQTPVLKQLGHPRCALVSDDLDVVAKSSDRRFLVKVDSNLSSVERLQRDVPNGREVLSCGESRGDFLATAVVGPRSIEGLFTVLNAEALKVLRLRSSVTTLLEQQPSDIDRLAVGHVELHPEVLILLH